MRSEGLGWGTRAFLAVQRRGRRLVDRLGSAPAGTLTPATGAELERFHDPAAALASWPSKQTQWWYWTGHLEDPGGRRFGFELVFFQRRTARDYLGVVPLRWLSPEMFSAHFALSDPAAAEAGRRFRCCFEGGLAERVAGSAAAARLDVQVGSWSARQAGDGAVRLRAAGAGAGLELDVTPRKPLCYHGRDGLSLKNAAGTATSFYCSYTRLAARGRLELDGGARDVTGEAWMDHEKMTSQNALFNAGWDWCSLQLESGDELMFFFVRERRDVPEVHSAGTWVAADGRIERLEHGDVLVEELRTWRSPATGGVYPVARRVRVPRLDLDLEVSALVDASELDAIRSCLLCYWEGAVAVAGRRAGQAVRGRGFVELVGYDRRRGERLLSLLAADG